jgi:hypothetical protein
VNVVRGALVVVILFDLALLAAVGPLRSTLLGYELARRQQELRRLSLEGQGLLHAASHARRPDRVAARAAAFGIELAPPGEEAPVARSAVRTPARPSSAPRPPGERR